MNAPAKPVTSTTNPPLQPLRPTQAETVIDPEALETLQVETDYAEHLEDRMGRYGY